MAIERVINFVVGVDGKVTCNGSRRPQTAGVQGDDGVCRIQFDMSAVFTGNERYFIEFVCGCGTSVILSEDSDIVDFDTITKMLSVVLSSEITSEGTYIEVCIVEEVLDIENNATAEGNTYVTYLELKPKGGVIRRLKETAYGIFIDCKKFMQKAVEMFETMKQKYDECVVKYELLEKSSLKKEIVKELPVENIDENTIYLVPAKTPDPSEENLYDEYIFIPNEREVKE